MPYYSNNFSRQLLPYPTTRLSSLTCLLIFFLFSHGIRGPMFYSLLSEEKTCRSKHSSMNLFVMLSLSSQYEATSISPFHYMLHVLFSVLHFSCYHFIFLVGCLFISFIGTFSFISAPFEAIRGNV